MCKGNDTKGMDMQEQGMGGLLYLCGGQQVEP